MKPSYHQESLVRRFGVPGLVLLTSLGLAGSALAMHKCVGADGKISFSDRPCPEGAAKQELSPWVRKGGVTKLAPTGVEETKTTTGSSSSSSTSTPKPKTLKEVADEGPCPMEPVDIYGTKLYKQCACTKMSYPDLEPVAAHWGVTLEPTWVLGSEYEGHGKLYVCGVKLRWKTKPATSSQCEVAKEAVVDEMDEVREVAKQLSWLSCPRR